MLQNPHGVLRSKVLSHLPWEYEVVPFLQWVLDYVMLLKLPWMLSCKHIIVMINQGTNDVHASVVYIRPLFKVVPHPHHIATRQVKHAYPLLPRVILDPVDDYIKSLTYFLCAWHKAPWTRPTKLHTVDDFPSSPSTGLVYFWERISSRYFILQALL